MLAFEECLYLANLNEDYKLKIKSLVSISACYLQMSDLHKVIFYYHKILDIESDLLTKISNKTTGDLMSMIQFNDEIINLELRIAIRQNLFTAHYRLGKLRICCFYLKEMILIIDSQLHLNSLENAKQILAGSLFELFEYVQIKMDAAVELCKFYVLFKEFMQLEALLAQMLRFVEGILEKDALSESMNEKALLNMKHFRIKCYAFMGVCQAGLREFRHAKLCTKKSLHLIEKQVQQHSQHAGATKSASTTNLTSISTLSLSSLPLTDSRTITHLKIECLLSACEACNQEIKTFRDMRSKMFKLLPEDLAALDEFTANEIKSVQQCFEQRIQYAKEAYLLSKTLIDPNLRAQATFEFAMVSSNLEFYLLNYFFYFNHKRMKNILNFSLHNIE